MPRDFICDCGQVLSVSIVYNSGQRIPIFREDSEAVLFCPSCQERLILIWWDRPSADRYQPLQEVPDA